MKLRGCLDGFCEQPIRDWSIDFDLLGRDYNVELRIARRLDDPGRYLNARHIAPRPDGDGTGVAQRASGLFALRKKSVLVEKHRHWISAVRLQPNYVCGLIRIVARKYDGAGQTSGEDERFTGFIGARCRASKIAA